LLLLSSRAAAPPEEGQKKLDLPVGLSPEQVKARVGGRPPDRVARQIVAHRCIEQWHYGPPLNLRLVFDCPRGEVPKLVRVRPAE
jgi:hypothetical protein